MTTLRDFITERQAEIKAEQAALRLESQELKAALEAINATAEQNSENGSRRPSGRATIKDRVVEALREHPGGGSAEEITAWIATAHGLTIPRSSLSPQISRLKAEGVVILNANKDWQLAEHPQADQEMAGGDKCSNTPPPTLIERRSIGPAELRAQGRAGRWDMRT